MKIIGLIGGMSWESTDVYYQHLNRMAHTQLGGLHSAKLLLHSFDFAEISELQKSGNWAAATQMMIGAARGLETSGADCILICTNTMHKMADDVQNAINIPLLHIADVTASAIQKQQKSAPLLLATQYTMEQDFYIGRLRDIHGIHVKIPSGPDRKRVHDIIYTELCKGVINPSSKQVYLDVITTARSDGADSVIFGCTEIGLLIQAADIPITAFDTTFLHAQAAMEFALS